MNTADRFFAKVVATGDGCLTWVGAKTVQGYGVFYADGKNIPAYRWLLDRFLGDQRPLVADHLCRNPACVRPSHIEFVTRGENVRRGIVGQLSRARAQAITHCPQGHPYDEENTYTFMRNGYKNRHCIQCSRAHTEAHRQRQKFKVVVYSDTIDGMDAAVDEAVWKYRELVSA